MKKIPQMYHDFIRIKKKNGNFFKIGGVCDKQQRNM